MTLRKLKNYLQSLKKANEGTSLFKMLKKKDKCDDIRVCSSSAKEGNPDYKKSTVWKIPKKTAEDWNEDIQTTSPFSRVAYPDNRTATYWKREHFVPKTNECHEYYKTFNTTNRIGPNFDFHNKTNSGKHVDTKYPKKRKWTESKAEQPEEAPFYKVCRRTDSNTFLTSNKAEHESRCSSGTAPILRTAAEQREHFMPKTNECHEYYKTFNTTNRIGPNFDFHNKTNSGKHVDTKYPKKRKWTESKEQPEEAPFYKVCRRTDSNTFLTSNKAEHESRCSSGTAPILRTAAEQREHFVPKTNECHEYYKTFNTTNRIGPNFDFHNKTNSGKQVDTKYPKKRKWTESKAEQPEEAPFYKVCRRTDNNTFLTSNKAEHESRCSSEQASKVKSCNVVLLDSEDDICSEVHESIGRLAIYSPPPSKCGHVIKTEDLECLEDGGYLNDVIIDFYLKYLMLEKVPPNVSEKCHIFSSYFYTSLIRRDSATSKLPSAQETHSRVKTWTRHVDIFSKDFIFVPVNQHFHWYLVVICYPGMEEYMYDETNKTNSTSSKLEAKYVSGDFGFNPEQIPKEYNGECSKRPCIIVFDSLNSGSAYTTVKVLKQYLEIEWNVKRKTPPTFLKNMVEIYAKVPKQSNGTDCGLYLLHYAESFFKTPIKNFNTPMHLENWFAQCEIKYKRHQIRDLILKLHSEQKRMVCN